MPKQDSKVCFSLLMVLSLLANFCVSESSSEQYAPTASETENEYTSSESYVSVPPSTNIPDVVTGSDQMLSPENVSTLSNANLEGEQNFFDQQLAPSPSVDIDPTIETKGDNNIPTSPSSPPYLTPAYVDTPAFETTDGGSFTQENHSPAPSNTVSGTSENVPQLNDYSSLPNAAVPAPSEALSYPKLDPTMQSTPSNDYTLDSAPTSDDHQHTVLSSNYRAEDEPVEPYEDEEDSWNGANGAVVGVFVGACVIGVVGFMYQNKKKKKEDNVKAEYESLANKDDA